MNTGWGCLRTIVANGESAGGAFLQPVGLPMDSGWRGLGPTGVAGQLPATWVRQNESAPARRAGGRGMGKEDPPGGYVSGQRPGGRALVPA